MSNPYKTSELKAYLHACWEKATGIDYGQEHEIAKCASERLGELEAALKDCADDLEAEVKAHYEGVLDYPSMKMKFDRDMQPVLRARELLE